MTLHFCGWNSIRLVFSHVASLSMSSCSRFRSLLDDICWYSIQSSAKSQSVLELMSPGRSLMKIRNRTGPTTDL